jgi:regulatory protein
MRFMFLMNSFIIENMEEKSVVSAVQPQKKKKDRYNVFVDGDYVASLGAQALVTFNIREGAAVDLDTLKEAVSADNAQYAFDSAAKLIAHKMRTRSELKSRLIERGLDEAAVDNAMDKLASYGYVDDDAFAKEYVRSAVATGRWGRKAVEYRLKDKGLEQSVIAQALNEYTQEDEKEIARTQFEAAAGRLKGIEAFKARQKIYATLARHGFDYTVISELLAAGAPGEVMLDGVDTGVPDDIDGLDMEDDD